MMRLVLACLFVASAIGAEARSFPPTKAASIEAGRNPDARFPGPMARMEDRTRTAVGWAERYEAASSHHDVGRVEPLTFPWIVPSAPAGEAGRVSVGSASGSLTVSTPRHVPRPAPRP